MKILKYLGILVGVAIIGFALYLDISWLLVGGIEEVVRGAQATPVSSHDIVWGVVRFLCSGLSTVVGILLGGLVIGGSVAAFD